MWLKYSWILAAILSASIVKAETFPSSKVYWNRGSRLEFGEHELRISSEFRSRYQYNSIERGRDTSEFRVTQARFAADGSLFNKNAAFFIKTELADDEAYLLDGGVNFKLNEDTSFKMGQYKPLFSRQYYTGEFRTQFPDYALISDNADMDRHPAMTLKRAFLLDSTLNLEIVNATGINKQNEGTQHYYLANWQIPLTGKIDTYTEGDLEYTEKFASDIGFTHAYGDIDESTQNNSAINFNAKLQGSSFHSEFFHLKKDSSDEADFGYYLQTGYFIIPRKTEIALRYARMNCSDSSFLVNCQEMENINEYGVSLIYFFWDHFLKLQVGHRILDKKTEENEQKTEQRTVMQLCAQF